ncbi:hypothetical protein CFOL_v3_02286 [Cephalotus follicularis]|uniref:Uncharacterized protein n=1 Tax=Cephalotus follicularis TaxID=3775 RepID=A0A1Q3AT69_CEPFO|nr:hypothetical protein CFOL_v3_02286 [Cephalotus follicularis]
MARNSDEYKCEGFNSDQEEEEEALSLSDLPINLFNEENQSRSEEVVQASKTEEEEFDFRSCGTTLSTEAPEMCAADDVFFEGQILPSRLSVCSESGLTRTQRNIQNPSQCVSRSDSMDHGSLCRVTSNSTSRSSSSSRSHYSSSSSSTSSTTKTRNLKQRIPNNFHTHPSPKPQITTRPKNVNNRTQQSSVWEFFRLGLVRTPEIELHDLKVRSSVSRNSSSSSSNSNSSCGVNYGSKSNHGLDKEKQRSQGLLDKRRGGLFGGGCRCSVSAVAAVPLNDIVIIKRSNNASSGFIHNKSASSTHAMKENKLQELKQKQQEGKRSMSRHRTFEWLKQLSHASYPDEA